MRSLRYPVLVLVVVLTTVGGADLAHPCSALRSSTMLDTFACPCSADGQQQQVPVFVASGTVSLHNRRAAPTLASLVIELQKRIGGRYTAVARQLLNERGDPMIHTCLGSFAVDPPTGSMVLTDATGGELAFADVKALPIGRVTLHYIAAFAGVTQLAPSDRVRVKVYATTIGAHASRTCTVDADGDGGNDGDVRTLTYQKTMTIPPAAPPLLTAGDVEAGAYGDRARGPF